MVRWLKCCVHRFGNKCAGGKNVNAEQGRMRVGVRGGEHNGKTEALYGLFRSWGAWQQFSVGVWIMGQHLILAGISLLFLKHPLMHQGDKEKDHSSNDWGDTREVEGHMVVTKAVSKKA